MMYGYSDMHSLDGNCFFGKALEDYLHLHYLYFVHF